MFGVRSINNISIIVQPLGLTELNESCQSVGLYDGLTKRQLV